VKLSLRSLLLLCLAMFGLAMQGVALPQEARAQDSMTSAANMGAANCETMAANSGTNDNQPRKDCGLPECLAMAAAGCAAVTLPGAQSVAKLSPRAMPSYFAATAQAPLSVLPFPEIKPPIR